VVWRSLESAPSGAIRSHGEYDAKHSGGRIVQLEDLTAKKVAAATAPIRKALSIDAAKFR